MSSFFSVIIPTYNRAELLVRAIESVLAQGFMDYELIIIDDGSSDNTRELICQFPQVQYFYQENQGVSRARNYGVEQSQGEWLCFLDSDDEWLPTKLQKQYSFICENLKSLWNHGEEIWIRNGVRVNPMKKHKKGGGDQFLPSLSLCLISPSTVCIKRSLYLENEGFREDFLVCEDYDLWLRLLIDHPIGFISDPLIRKYGGHEDQLSRKFIAMDEWRVRTLESLLKTNLGVEREKEIRKVLSAKIEVLYKGYLKHGNEKKAQLYRSKFLDI